MQDHSLTYEKLVNGTLGFVTPEMFGAKGDGVTDDTTAWQNAVDVGLPVLATKKQYKCGQIDVTKNISIDCNGADFVCTMDKLFYCSGEVVTTLQNESDYSSNQIGYAITSGGYTDYTGFAMIKGTNNFEKARSYYLGGFPCEFKNGLMTEAYPIDVTDVSIEIITPITVQLSNVGNIEHLSGGERSIEILYGLNCSVVNADMPKTNSYMVICFDSSLNCLAYNVNIKQIHLDESTQTQTYLIGIINSCFCTIKKCHQYNHYWHCISTGGIYLVYHTVIDNCKLTSYLGYAYCDHDNALNTIITNTESTGILVSGLSSVRDCTCYSIEGNQYKDCRIRANAVSNENHAIYNIENVYIKPNPNASRSYVGISISSSPQTTGNTYYVKLLNIKNIYSDFANLGGVLDFSLPSTSNYVIKKVNVDNINLFIVLCKTSSSQTYIDISNYILYVKNFNHKIGNNYLPIGYTNYIFNDMVLDNCVLANLYGVYRNLTMNNIESTLVIDPDYLTVNGKLTGSDIKTRIKSAVFATPSEVSITSMLWDSGDKAYYYNITKDKYGGVYAQRLTQGQAQVITFVEPS